MAEGLGDALLTLRTDDAQFNAGVTRAEGRARQMGATLDKTSGSSARLASGMAKTGQSAAQMGAGFQRGGQQVVASSGSQRAGMQQLGFQISDVAQQFSLGVRPQVIFAQQAGQVLQAIQLMAGGTSRLAGILGGQWVIGLTAATVVLAPFIGKLFETDEALESVELGSDAFGDAQDRLAKVIDLVTGKLSSQNLVLRESIRLQALKDRREAGAAVKAGREEVSRINPLILRRDELGRLIPTSVRINPEIEQLKKDAIDGSLAIEGLGQRVGELLKGSDTDALRVEKRIEDTTEVLLKLAQARQEERVAQETIDTLDGKGLAADLRKPPDTKKGSKGPSQEDIDARFNSQLVGVTQQILSARISIAGTAEERAELEARIAEWDRRQSIAKIEADEDLSRAQKDELQAATTRLADAELQAIEFSKRAVLERDAQALADEQYEAQRDALQLQFALADTESERKAIALKMLETEEAYLRSRLLSVILSDTANEAERLRAQPRLDALRANSAARRESVARANETTTGRFMRDLNKTPRQINEAIDRIKIDGLEAFNDELVNAIVNFRSLGDVARSVLKQILADLLRLQIQQAIIKPLAARLGIGGGGGGFLGSLLKDASATINNPAYAGLFAAGGLIPRGQFGIVGERGPEPVFATGGGVQVLPNSALRRGSFGGGGGMQINVPVNIDAAGADPAALERVRGQIDRLRAELPGLIVGTVQDAGDRRLLSLGGGR